jgi:hypothetical protein
MSGWKGGGLLLVLAIPLALYAAWQVKGVVRADMVVSDPPPDRGGSKEQLADAKNKAAKWAGDVRKASTVTLQYSQPGTPDTPSDASAAEVVKTAADRSKDLTDLDLFLSGARTEFSGKLRTYYKEWEVSLRKAIELGRAVIDFLARMPPIASGADATRFMAELEEKLREYQDGSNFASRRQAAVWRIQGRLAVIKELGTRADEQYPDAVSQTLPLKSDNKKMVAALTTFAAVQAQVKALDGDVDRAKAEGPEPEGTLRGDINDRKAIAGKCARRERLLQLCTRDDLFTNSTGSTAWLRDVSTLYRDTKEEADRKYLRKKVQEFCEEFLPIAVRLDDEVRFKDKIVQRKNLVVEYEPAAGAARQQVALSDRTDGLNEFNVADKYPGRTTDVRHLGAPGRPTDLEPTPLSKAAKFYNEERKAVPPGTIGPKWTAKSVEDLKKKCEPQRDLIDKLKLPRKKDDKSPDEEQMIFARLEGVQEGLKACADWIEGP